MTRTGPLETGGTGRTGGAARHRAARAGSLPRAVPLQPPATARRILHLDVDAFLASVEQAVHPELRGRPVVVGGMPQERNLVMSCSYDARAYGVRPGMLLAEAARRCPRAVFRRGDSAAATRLRERVTHILRSVSPVVEVASIDDFFVDLSACRRLAPRAGGHAFATAEALRERVRAETYLPLTIGIGTNRTLARLAGKLAKPGGVAEVLPGGEAAFLEGLPVEHLPGVGHAIGAALERFGVRTAGELARIPREVLFASFGRPGLVAHDRARGIDDEPVEATYEDDGSGRLRPRLPASIRRDSTFEPEEGRRERVEAMLAYVVERAAARLRALGAAARSVEVRARYVDTRTAAARRAQRAIGGDPDGDPGPTSLHKRRALPHASDSTDELIRAARALYRELPRRRALTKRVGVTLIGLERRVGWQGTLFSDPGADRPLETHGGGSRADRQRRLDRALDALRARHGFGRLLRGVSLPLIETHELGPDGFRLRTPSLNQ